MKEQYFFGATLAKQIDFFAYPRCGNHYFLYCLSGLFDLVSLPTEHIDNHEAIDRQRELNRQALYALDLREGGVPYRPLYVESNANGMHGVPTETGRPTIILIRDPIDSAYSFYRVAPVRWGLEIADEQNWLLDYLHNYMRFYDAALRLLEDGSSTLLVRYRDLLASPDALHRVVQFVGLAPKLAPEFVHWLTAFERFAAPVDRTFYRSGSPGAWHSDDHWRALLQSIAGESLDFRRFGYHVLADYTRPPSAASA